MGAKCKCVHVCMGGGGGGGGEEVYENQQLQLGTTSTMGGWY